MSVWKTGYLNVRQQAERDKRMTEPAIETREGRAAIREQVDRQPHPLRMRDALDLGNWVIEATLALDARDDALAAAEARVRELEARRNQLIDKLDAVLLDVGEAVTRIADLEARLAEPERSTNEKEERDNDT